MAEKPTSRDFWQAIRYLRPAIGKAQYWVWTNGIIPDGPGAFAYNGPPPPIKRVINGGIFCAGVPNLILRHVGKRVPYRLNNRSPLYDGGIAAYFDGVLGDGYFHDFDRPFNIAAAKRMANRSNCGVLIGRPYSGAALPDQGHVAVVLPAHTDGNNYVLQSNGGDGLNWTYTIEQSHNGWYYTTMVSPDNWFKYSGDEF
jgi:hypothetical protein